MPLVKNSEHTVRIVGYSSDGAGVSRINGQVVFTPCTIRGELCKIKIIKVNKSVAFARLIEVLEKSEHRIKPMCEVYPKCGGCDYMHMDYDEELYAKEEHVRACLSRIGGLDIEVSPIVGAQEILRYRNKAQFPIGGDAKAPIAGFYRPHSHDIVECSDCKIQSEYANAVCQTVLAWMKSFGIPPYDEHKGSGIVRHVYVRNRMVCIVVTKKPKQLNALIESVLNAHPETTGIVLNYNALDTNVILGDKCETVFGSGVSTDALCGNEFELSPHAFYQVNHAQATRLYNLAIEMAELCGEETVLDLYCGAGTITLALARCAKFAFGVEIISDAVENAKRAAQKNNLPNTEFICGDAAFAARSLRERNVQSDVVVVDPPRKGLASELIKTISQIGPKRIVYVSCDAATLARDLKVFSEYGYETKKCTPVDMFPRTRHVECCVLLCRVIR